MPWHLVTWVAAQGAPLSPGRRWGEGQITGRIKWGMPMGYRPRLMDGWTGWMDGRNVFGVGRREE